MSAIKHMFIVSALHHWFVLFALCHRVVLLCFDICLLFKTSLNVEHASRDNKLARWMVLGQKSDTF